MFIKRTRVGKLYSYRMLLILNTPVTYIFFKVTPDDCVLCETDFVGYNSVFLAVHSPMSGVNIQA